jgi:tetratricopeptide (TPR) repeat protein
MTQFARAFSVVGVVAIFGALGGFVLGMTYPAAHEITMPGLAGRSYPMGFLGDMLVGAGAGIGAIFLLGALFGVDLNKVLTNTDWARLVSLSVLCGFMGIKLFEGFSHATEKRLSEAVGDKIQEKVQASEQRLNESVDRQLTAYNYLLEGKKGIVEAKKLIHDGNGISDSEKAQETIDRALLDLDHALLHKPNDTEAMIEKAKALALYAKNLPDGSKARKQRLSEAIQLLSDVIENDPDDPRPYYNRACYYSLLQTNIDQALKDLDKAMSGQESYAKFSAEDGDLAYLRESQGPELARIVAQYKKGDQTPS